MKKLIQFFTFDMEGKYDSEVVDNVFIINVFTLLGSLFCIMYAVIAVFQHLYALVAVLVFSVIAIIFNFFYLRITKNFRFSAVFTVNFLGLMVSSFLFVSDFSNGSYLWFFIFPPIALTVLGFRRGTVSCIIPLIFALVVFFVPYISSYYPDYKLVFEIRFISVYIFIYIISAFILYRNKKRTFEFEKLYLDADNSTRTKTEVILHLLHHVRTTLNSIVGLVPMIKDSTLESERREYASTVGNIVESLVKEAEEINSLLESGLPKTEADVTFSLHETIKRFVGIYQDPESDKKIRITFDFPNEANDFYYGNPNFVTKLLYNVCEAIKVRANNEAEVHLRLYYKSKSAGADELLFEFSTCDIPLEKLKSLKPLELFDYFDGIASYDSAPAVNYQFLYNLSVSRQILKNFKGEVGVRIVGNEIVIWFNMFLKFHSDLADTTSRINQQPKISATNEVLPNKSGKLSEATVLIAEDNATNLQVLKFGIAGKVKNIIVAENGTQALELFSKHKIDLILLDIEMPKLDGFEVLKKIRELEQGMAVHIPVIAITAYVSKEIKEKCLTSGFDDYIGKPYRVNELIGLMEKALQRTSYYT